MAFSVDDVCGIGYAVVARIGPRPVGRLAVEKLPEQRERAATELHAPTAVHIGRRAVVGIVARDIAARVDVHVRCERPLFHHQVHDTRDGVGAVLGRRAVPQHLHAVDGTLRNRVQVHAARAGTHAVGEVVHQSGLVLPPAVDQDERLVGGEATQREGPDDVASVGDALVGKIHRRRQRLEHLTRLRGALLLHLLRREHVHGNGQLVRRRVARARADHDVHRGQPDRLRVQREVLAGGLPFAHGDAHDLRHIAEQPRPHRLRACRHAADFVLPLLVGGGARADRLDADAHPRQRRTGRVGHAAADRPALSRESRRSRDQHQHGAGDHTDNPSHRRSFLLRGGTAATNPHAARYTAGSGGRQARWGGKKNRRAGGPRRCKHQDPAGLSN